MNKIVVEDRIFTPYISSIEIEKAVKSSAEKINRYYSENRGDKVPVFISILNGAFMYTSDLLKEVDFECEIEFIKVSSYQNTQSTGTLKSLIGLKNPIEGRDIIVLDDIVDSGLTMKAICTSLSEMNPSSIKIGAFIYKPDSCLNDVVVDFPSIIMKEDIFIIGYGLDYNEKGRNLKDIYILDEL